MYLTTTKSFCTTDAPTLAKESVVNTRYVLGGGGLRARGLHCHKVECITCIRL